MNDIWVPLGTIGTLVSFVAGFAYTAIHNARETRANAANNEVRDLKHELAMWRDRYLDLNERRGGEHIDAADRAVLDASVVDLTHRARPTGPDPAQETT